LTESDRELARVEIRDALTEHWPAVQALAARLMEPLVMTGDDAERTIRSAVSSEQIRSRQDLCPWLWE
jgi:hypothetical protein